MNLPPALAGLADAVTSLCEAWGAAIVGEGADPQSDVESMTEAGILAANEALAAVRREADALHVRVAGGIGERSRPELGADGLARKTGHRTPAKLIAAATGAHTGDAARLVELGEATRERATLSGNRAPSRHPFVSAAIADARISVDAAVAITKMLDKVALRADPGRLAEAERLLVEHAAMLTLQELGAVIRRAEAWLDPDGLEPKIDDLRSARSLTIREEASGMFVFTAKLDPETAAPIKAAIDGIVTHQLRTHRGHNHPGAVTVEGGAGSPEGDSDAAARAAREASEIHGDVAGEGAEGAGGAPVAEETRSLAQLQADALAAISRHALGCDSSGLPLATTTVIVRLPLEALTAGTGVATIDGITQPIDAGTARRMAADADIIPVVLGGDSEILDFGRAKRLFTPAQRLAIEERDGGCAFCGLPGKYTEGHHLWWWSLGGPTDLRECLLLCTSCHHRVHNDGWEIRIDLPPSGDPTGGKVWFIPPAYLDPARTPRLGGRARFDWMLAA